MVNSLARAFAACLQSSESHVCDTAQDTAADLLEEMNNSEGCRSRLLEVCPVIWGHLSQTSHIALRSTCREARALHDSLRTSFSTLRCGGGGHGPAESVAGFVSRGGRPQTLVLALLASPNSAAHDSASAAAADKWRREQG
jgi:hypothetical protein